MEVGNHYVCDNPGGSNRKAMHIHRKGLYMGRVLGQTKSSVNVIALIALLFFLLQPSLLLSSPSPPAFNFSQNQGLFQ